jgi:hypothetical protein
LLHAQSLRDMYSALERIYYTLETYNWNNGRRFIGADSSIYTSMNVWRSIPTLCRENVISAVYFSFLALPLQGFSLFASIVMKKKALKIRSNRSSFIYTCDKSVAYYLQLGYRHCGYTNILRDQKKTTDISDAQSVVFIFPKTMNKTSDST